MARLLLTMIACLLFAAHFAVATVPEAPSPPSATATGPM